MTNHKIAVVIVLYGLSYWEARRIVCRILSQQNSTDLLVLVNNNPIAKWLKRLSAISPRVFCIESGANIGYCAGANTGADFASGKGADYVCFLNPDVQIGINFIDSLRQSILKHPKSIISPLILLEDKKTVWYAGGWYSPLFGYSRHNFYRKKIANVHIVTRKTELASGCCMVVPVSVRQKLGGLDSDLFMYYDDQDFSQRAMRMGVDIIFDPEISIVHDNQSSKFNSLQAYYFARNPFLLIRKHTPAIYRPLSWLSQFAVVLPRNILRLKDVEAGRWYFIGLWHGVTGHFGREKRLS